MTQSPADVVRGMCDAFARADIQAILGALDEQIDWRAPSNLPHGGHFTGRDAVGRFFQGIGEQWESLTVDVEPVLADGEKVVVLATLRGKLRATTEDTGYTAAHAWTLCEGTPVGFAETVDAPITLPAAVTPTQPPRTATIGATMSGQNVTSARVLSGFESLRRHGVAGQDADPDRGMGIASRGSSGWSEAGWRCRSLGMSPITQSPEAAVSPATIAIALP